MNKLKLEMRIVAETDQKMILQTSVSVESLSNLRRTSGEAAVNKAVWEMFNRLMEELNKPVE